MPPTRHQSLKEVADRRPYTKDRDRQHNARGASAPEKGLSATAPMPVASSSDSISATAASKGDKKRKAEATGGNGGRGGKNHAVPLSGNDADGPLSLPKTAHPSVVLGTYKIDDNSKVSNTHSQPHAATEKTKMPSNAVSKGQKGEEKIEKQRIRLKEAEARLAKIQDQGKRDAERILALEARVNEQERALRIKEEELASQKQRADDHAETIESHLADRDQVNETLQDAVCCLICSDTLRDPHILSCGHIACRDCLKSWFRQPNAYLHDVGETITPTRDLSFRSKVCHVCRTTVIRRPTRMYNLYSFLEPLGIVPNISTVSQEQADPWENSFPVEKVSYKLHDAEDETARCPQCLHEVYDGSCDNCGAEFSDDEESDEVMMGETSDGEGDEAAGRPVAGRRRAQVDIATIEEVLGDSADDAAPPRQATRPNPMRVARRGTQLSQSAYEEDERVRNGLGGGTRSRRAHSASNRTRPARRGQARPLTASEDSDDGTPPPPNPMRVARRGTQLPQSAYEEDERVRNGLGPSTRSRRPNSAPNPLRVARRGMQIPQTTSDSGRRRRAQDPPQPSSRRLRSHASAVGSGSGDSAQSQDSVNSDETHGFSDGDQSHTGTHEEPNTDTEDEYDGSVPRVFTGAGRNLHSADEEEDEDMEEEESAYGGSFIDDEEDEEGYDLGSTGSLDD